MLTPWDGAIVDDEWARVGPDELDVLRRETARVLLFDNENELLLVQGSDPYRPQAGSWWFPVGGGRRQGETLEAALRREVWEETGLTDVVIGPMVWTGWSEFPYMESRVMVQREHYYYGRTVSKQIDYGRWTSYERKQLLRMRWWTMDELLASRERVIPRELRSLIVDLAGGVYPEPPIELSPNRADNCGR